MLFEHDEYTPNGGMDDFVQDFEKLADAIERIKSCNACLVSIYDNIAMRHFIHREWLNKINIEKLKADGEKYIIDTIKEAGLIDIRELHDEKDMVCNIKPKSIEQIKADTENFKKGD